jgi:hypothetical protein
MVRFWDSVPDVFQKSQWKGRLKVGEREDKKHQTKPNVSMLVHEVVGDVRRYLGSSSAGETARRIAWTAFETETVIERLSPYFWRDFTRGDFYWPGHNDPEDIGDLLPDKWTRSKRLPIRFQQHEWKRLDGLSFALGKDRANTISALLRLAIESQKVLQNVAPGYCYRSEYSLKKGVIR